MNRLSLLIVILLLFGIQVQAQKMTGFGGELSVLSIKPNARIWFSKTTGLELFGGQAAELEDFNPNDFEVGLKFLRTIQYNRTDRTYFGIMGKWKWIDVYEPTRTTSLPIPGILIGKEWYSKRIKRKAFAIELGYQVGVKDYKLFSPINHDVIGSDRFEEFPLILNLRYNLYKKR